MPTIRFFKYEFSDYDEAMAAFYNYNISQPPNVAPYPYFEIDKIDITSHDDMTIWLKLKKEE